MNSIEVDEVSKVFRLYKDRPGSVKEMFTKFGRKRYEDFWAVRDVSLAVPEGSVHGLIGHNGCGKSTLLRMMAGIHTPTKGKITTKGRVSALLELGAGFHPDLTGRENVYLNAAILGLSRKQTDSLFDKIVAFSGLEPFIDSPVKHYSSGMFVRLGFSVAVHVEPQILLVDEVIAVGDEEFQRRCLDHLASLKKSGVTIVIVSHAMGVMQNLCDQVTWLDHGRVLSDGIPLDVVGSYLHEVNAEEERRAALNEEIASDRILSGASLVHRAELLDVDGREIGFGRTGEPVVVRVHSDGAADGALPGFVLSVESESGILLGSTRASGALQSADGESGETFIECRLDPLLLAPGNYVVKISGVDLASNLPIGESWDLPLLVRAEGEVVNGLFEFPAQWSVPGKESSSLA